MLYTDLHGRRIVSGQYSSRPASMHPSQTTDQLETAPLQRLYKCVSVVATHAFAGFLAVVIFHLSLITTSQPMAPDEMATIERAIALLDEKGFGREALLLRTVVSYRSTDHWLNLYVEKEDAYAATNVPFGIVTLYHDFYTKAVDDTERAMILLHEARHLQMANEREAYAYVWRNRERLGWTQITHGTTPAYITISAQTREHSPELFTCPDRIWNDCTETMPTRPQVASK